MPADRLDLSLSLDTLSVPGPRRLCARDDFVQELGLCMHDACTRYRWSTISASSYIVPSNGELALERVQGGEEEKNLSCLFCSDFNWSMFKLDNLLPSTTCPTSWSACIYDELQSKGERERN